MGGRAGGPFDSASAFPPALRGGGEGGRAEGAQLHRAAFRGRRSRQQQAGDLQLQVSCSLQHARPEMQLLIYRPAAIALLAGSRKYLTRRAVRMRCSVRCPAGSLTSESLGAGSSCSSCIVSHRASLSCSCLEGYNGTIFAYGQVSLSCSVCCIFSSPSPTSRH